MEVDRNNEKEISDFWCADRSNKRIDAFSKLGLLKARFFKQAFPPHVHETYGFGVVVNGKVETKQRREYRIASVGHVILFNPDEVHSNSAVDELGWTYRMFYPSEELIKKVIPEIKGKQNLPFFQNPSVYDPELCKLILDLHVSLERNPLSVKHGENFDRILGYIISKYSQEKLEWCSTINDRDFIQFVENYIEKNLSNHSFLSDLAKELNYCETYISDKYSKIKGMTIREYRKSLQAFNALKQIQIRDELDLNAIARNVGISHQGDFSRCFRERIGVTPRQCRKSFHKS